MKHLFLVFCVCSAAIMLHAQQQEIPAGLLHRMEVKAIPDKKSIYVGEPVIVTYEYATALTGSSHIDKQPVFEGCSVKDLDYEQGGAPEIRNGEVWKKFVLRRVQLIPLHPGTLNLGIASVIDKTRLPSSDDPFVYKEYTLTAANTPTSVNVIPLPAGEPENFSGLVGNFSIKLEPSATEIPTGENAHLIITIEGMGNLDAVTAPVIAWPAELEHFTPAESANDTSIPLNTSHSFDYTFLAKKEGPVVIPPVEFNFFNTATGHYEQLKTPPVKLLFKPALPAASLQDVPQGVDTNRKYLWLVPVIGLAAALAGLLLSRQKPQSPKPAPPSTPVPVTEEKQEPALPPFHFEAAMEKLEGEMPGTEFFAAVKQIMLEMLRASLPSHLHHLHELLPLMRNRQLNEAAILAENLWQQCNRNLYAAHINLAEKDECLALLKKLKEKLV